MLAEAERLLHTKLPEFPPIVGAYLFGSILDDDCPPRDIDVALVVAPSINRNGLQPMNEREAMRLEANVAAALSTLHGKAFDVCVLSTQDIIFSMSVLRRGRLVYEADSDALTDFIEYVSRRHADVLPRYRRALNEVLEEVRS